MMVPFKGLKQGGFYPFSWNDDLLVVKQPLLGENGVLLKPTMLDIAPLLTAEESERQRYRDAAIQMLCIAGLSGFPQISLPMASRDLMRLWGFRCLGRAGRELIALAGGSKVR
jgi:Asp-tRNA(Asn)/Glu-tRNA(Gln) amidotransferase A subunit family amidase